MVVVVTSVGGGNVSDLYAPGGGGDPELPSGPPGLPQDRSPRQHHRELRAARPHRSSTLDKGRCTLELLVN